MDQAEKILSQRGNKVTMEGDRIVAAFIRKNGKQQLTQLKRDNHNLKLEDCVMGADQKEMVEVVDSFLVPRMGQVFLTPLSRNGNAPFYSSVKIIGSCTVKTMWFNLAVLILMGGVATLLLLTDCPGQYMRKDNR